MLLVDQGKYDFSEDRQALSLRLEVQKKKKIPQLM